MDYLILVLGGVISGMLTSLFGLGGGSTIVPILVSCLFLFGIPKEYIMHFAVGTSLAIMLVNSLIATRSYMKDKDINYNLLSKFIPFVILGSIAGAFIGARISSLYLMIFFVVFICVVIAKNLLTMKKNKSKKIIETKEATPPKITGIGIGGIVSGIIGALAGGGCGIIVVTYLKEKHYQIKKSVGIATALNIIIAITVSISYAIENSSGHVNVPWSLGFIYLPAFALMLIGCFIGVPLGKFIVNKVHDTKLTWGFLIVLLFSMGAVLYKIIQYF